MRRGSIGPSILEALETNPALAELVEHVEQVPGRACQAVEAGGRLDHVVLICLLVLGRSFHSYRWNGTQTKSAGLVLSHGIGQLHQKAQQDKQVQSRCWSTDHQSKLVQH